MTVHTKPFESCESGKHELPQTIIMATTAPLYKTLLAQEDAGYHKNALKTCEKSACPSRRRQSACRALT